MDKKPKNNKNVYIYQGFSKKDDMFYEVIHHMIKKFTDLITDESVYTEPTFPREIIRQINKGLKYPKRDIEIDYTDCDHYIEYLIQKLSDRYKKNAFINFEDWRKIESHGKRQIEARKVRKYFKQWLFHIEAGVMNEYDKLKPEERPIDSGIYHGEEGRMTYSIHPLALEFPEEYKQARDSKLKTMPPPTAKDSDDTHFKDGIIYY